MDWYDPYPLRERIGDWFDDHFGLVVCAVVALAIVGLVWAAGEEQKEWDAWARQHHCRLVSTADGTVVSVFGGKSVSFGYVPGKDGYACDDGVVHYRDR